MMERFNKAQAIIGVNLITSAVMKAYSEPHRHWHNVDHLMQVFTDIVESHTTYPDRVKAAILAAVYHDAVYDPHSKTNEEDSVKFMLEDIKNNQNPWTANSDVVDTAAIFIMDTKNLKASGGINYYDRKIFTSTNLMEVISYGKKIWKEYNFVSWETFVTEHLKTVEDLFDYRQTLILYKEWLRTHKPTLALYPGSFKPFHVGHKDVADKANKVFDKVLIARGVNLEKVMDYDPSSFFIDSHSTIAGYESLNFVGMLPRLFNELSTQYDVTIVKGIRNAQDLEYEQTQEAFLRSLNPHIKIMYVFSDPSLKHISSSAIRNLEKYGQDVSKYLT